MQFYDFSVSRKSFGGVLCDMVMMRGKKLNPVSAEILKMIFFKRDLPGAIEKHASGKILKDVLGYLA